MVKVKISETHVCFRGKNFSSQLYYLLPLAMTPPGNLYIVATPIGNLQDISTRALTVLAEVDFIAAEDTRHSRRLLDNFGINTPMVAYHQHNQSKRGKKLIQQLLEGASVAVVTDAGTPLIADPGAQLVKHAHQQGIQVIPIPGASALSAALSICGFDIGRFHFEGFLPARQNERLRRLQQLKELTVALVFFEAPHRIVQSLDNMTQVFGAKRLACLAREMTKIHETVRVDRLAQLVRQTQNNQPQRKGEFVVIVEPDQPPLHVITPQVEQAIKILSEELSPRKAAAIAAKIFGLRRNLVYRQVLTWQNESPDDAEPPS